MIQTILLAIISLSLLNIAGNLRTIAKHYGELNMKDAVAKMFR